MFALKLEGAEKLSAMFQQLPLAAEKKILRKALRAGAKPIAAEAKARAPKLTGKGAKSIKVRAMSRMKRGSVGVRVMTGEGDYQGKEFYMSFIEHGYFKHPAVRKPDGTFFTLSEEEMKRQHLEPTYVPPRPFMRPAFDSAQGRAQEAIAQAISAGIAEEAKKLAAAPGISGGSAG